MFHSCQLKKESHMSISSEGGRVAHEEGRVVEFEKGPGKGKKREIWASTLSPLPPGPHRDPDPPPLCFSPGTPFTRTVNVPDTDTCKVSSFSFSFSPTNVHALCFLEFQPEKKREKSSKKKEKRVQKKENKWKNKEKEKEKRERESSTSTSGER